MTRKIHHIEIAQEMQLKASQDAHNMLYENKWRNREDDLLKAGTGTMCFNDDNEFAFQVEGFKVSGGKKHAVIVYFESDKIWLRYGILPMPKRPEDVVDVKIDKEYNYKEIFKFQQEFTEIIEKGKSK